MTTAPFDQAVRVARDRVSASDVLDRAPHRAESLRVLARGLSAIEAAIEQIEAKDRSGWRSLSSSDRQALVQLRQRLEAAPEDDRLLSSADLAARRDARRLALRTLRRLREESRSRRAVLARRAAWLLLALAIVALIGAALHLRDREEIVASDRYSASYDAEKAIDGDTASEWLAPDGAAAWIELKFRSPVDVSAVRVVNARNAPKEDRATKDLEVTLFDGDRLLQKTMLTLPKVSEAAGGHTIPVAASHVTRIRLSALSHYGFGAGLAEIEVVERKP